MTMFTYININTVMFILKHKIVMLFKCFIGIKIRLV